VRIFLIGGSGYVGRHLTRRLAAEGRQVTALARSAGAADIIAQAGGRPLLASLDDAPAVAQASDLADAVIYVAQFPTVAEETCAVRAGLDRCAGKDKIFVMTSGTGVLCRDPGGGWSEPVHAEDDPFDPHPLLRDRVLLEDEVRARSGEIGRAMVIRPPQVYGHGGSVALPGMIAEARRRGFVPFVGPGLSIWSNVHVDDLCDLYIRMLDAGSGGSLYHAVGGEHCERHLALEVGNAMGLPARSIAISDIAGPYRSLAGCSSRSRAIRSRDELGWRPRSTDMFTDLLSGSYFTALQDEGIL